MKVLKRLWIVFLILFFCQAPVFVAQYRMHLEGHQKEAKKFHVLLSKTAEVSGKKIDEYIKWFEGHADSDVKNQGAMMQEIESRYEFLCQATKSLEQTNPLFRPFVFLRYMDVEIGIETAKSFSPGILITEEILLWAVFGWIFAAFLLPAFYKLLAGAKRANTR